MSRQREDPAESERWEAAMVASEQRQAAARLESERPDTERRTTERRTDTGGYTDYGFTWGPATVERMAAIARGPGLYRVLSVRTDRRSQDLQIYISPSGSRVRVFRGGRELT